MSVFSDPVAHPRAARIALPAALLLLIQVGLYVWMAPRGFDLTDEAYYLHNFLHWSEFTGTVTFFGAYLEWPFRAMGASITGMRILSLVLVLASAGLLMHELLRWSSRSGKVRPGAFWYLVGPMASAMLYFGYLATLRVASYNLLAVASMAVMTVCMLRAMQQREAGAYSFAPPLLYGLALGVCVLSKVTAAAFTACLHLVFFIAVNRHWDRKWLLRLTAWVIAGFALNLAVLTAVYPQWPAVVREGLEIARLRDSTYTVRFLMDVLRWDVEKKLVFLGPWLLGAAVLLFLARKRIATASRGAISALTVVIVAAIPVSILAELKSTNWLFITVASALALWSIEQMTRPQRQTRAEILRDWALMAVLFSLPIAFSFGTNMPVLGHSIIAALFAFCAVYLRLYRLAESGKLAGLALATCVALLCVPALMAQWRALTDVRHTYRLATEVAKQATPVVLGTEASVVLVDPVTERSLRDMLAMTKQAGMPAGQDVVDLTGDGAGAIYAIGAKPLGSPWILGGYKGSTAAAERILGKVSVAQVRNAWLLTSVNNPRRVKDWQDMLSRRIGPATHQLVAEIEVLNHQFANRNEPKTVNLQLWKPNTALARAAGPEPLSQR